MVDATIANNPRHLRAALNWAFEVGMLETKIVVRMPTRSINSKVMRGRPIAGEEFERMLAKVPAAVGFCEPFVENSQIQGTEADAPK